MALWNWASLMGPLPILQMMYERIWGSGGMMLMEKLKDSEKNLSQYNFVRNKFHTYSLERTPRPPQ
jgi:hypothetical protein